MPTWSNTVPSAAIKHGYELRRTPPDQVLRAVITSADLLGCYTHYWTGRTLPCEAPNCPACEAQNPSRWHAYVSCMDAKTREHFLFECTANAAKSLELYRDNFGTLRGCLITASRPRRRKNARVEIITQPADLSKIKLPQPIDLQKALSVIWQIPATAIETPTALHSTPTVALRNDVMDQTRDPADNGNGHATKLKPQELFQ